MLNLSGTVIARLYVAFFGRAPDTQGLDYWLNNNTSLLEMAESFFAQPEAQTLYAGLGDKGFITAVYRNVFNREPDTEGLAYWQGELTKLGQAGVVLAMLNSAQGDDVLLLENKAEVGLYYAVYGDGSPNAWQVIEQCGLSLESVQRCKDWVDGIIPPNVNPGRYAVLANPKEQYDLKGTGGDDVFVVKKFLSLTLDGGYGEDTVDFSALDDGVVVNLSTGVGDSGINVRNMEHLRGTAQADELLGNAENNILVAGGGKGDKIDASLGNDRILFKNLRDVDNAVQVNGGLGVDTLEITDSIVIDLTNLPANGGSNVLGIEVLQIGYSEEGNAEAATLKVGTSGIPLTQFQTIRGSASFDKKGRPTDDTIVYVGGGSLLDVAQVALLSIEGLQNRIEGGRVRINAQTLTELEYITGAKGQSSILELNAHSGDVFDLGGLGLVGFDRIQQLTTVDTTLVVNQSLVDSLNQAFTSQVVFSAGGFAESTLRMAGDGLDLSQLLDGDYNFKTFEYGDASSLVLGQVQGKLSSACAINGAAGSADYLAVVHDVSGVEDLTQLAIRDVEHLDVEGVTTLRLDNGNVQGGVRFLSGDEGSGGVVKTRLDGSQEQATGGLDLRGIHLSAIVGLEGAGAYTLDVKTSWDAAFTDLGVTQANLLLLSNAGNYDFSQIKTAQQGVLAVESLAITNQVRGDARFNHDSLVVTVTGDVVEASQGDDTLKGGETGFGYRLGAGNDRFVGADTANEWVSAGDGNDTLELGDNLQGVSLVSMPLPIIMPGSFDGKGGVAEGGIGDDAITSGKGNDVLFGGVGHDRLVGGDGHDLLAGEDGHDILSGGSGHDMLLGGEGNDVVQADAGNDVLYGGKGVDALRGGTVGLAGSQDGQDKFYFAAGDSGFEQDSVDVITDFYSHQHAVKELGATQAGSVHDFIHLDWYAGNVSAGLYKGGAPLEALDVASGQGVAVSSGGGYGVLFEYFKDAFVGFSSLLDAAEAALDQAYTLQAVSAYLSQAGVAGDAKADYTALAVQFEYGGKFYVAVDAYVDNSGAVNNKLNPLYDLLVNVEGLAGIGSLSAGAAGALDVEVVRWDSLVI